MADADRAHSRRQKSSKSSRSALPQGSRSHHDSKSLSGASSWSSSSTSPAAGSSLKPGSPLERSLLTLESPRSSSRGGVGRRLSLQARAFLMEVGLLLLHLAHLGVQSSNLYRSHFDQYDFDVILIAAACLGRHLLLRHLKDTLTNAKRLERHLATHPRISGITIFFLVVLPSAAALRLVFLRRTTCLFFVLLPTILCMVRFQHLFPIPWPPDLLHLSGINNNASNKGPRRRLAPYVIRYLLYRLVEATYTTAILPLLAVQDPHLFYRPWRCAAHSLIFTAQTSLLLMAQVVMVLREQLHAEGEPCRTWSLVLADKLSSSSSISRWRPGEQFSAGSVVVHKGRHYVATGLRQVQPGGRFPEPPAEAPLSVDQRWIYEAFAGEGGQARTSPLLLALQILQALGTLVLMCIMMRSLQWVPYGVMLLGSFGTLALINVAQSSGSQPVNSTNERTGHPTDNSTIR